MRCSRPLLALTVLLGAILAVGVGLVAGSGIGRPSQTLPAAGPSAAAPAERTATMTRFRDEQAGFSIAHPAGWRRTAADDRAVRLLADGGEASLLVRSVPRGDGKPPSSRELVRGLAAAGDDVRIVARATQIRLGGLPGRYYVYTFTDDAGRTGLHAHYFLFGRDRILTLVLQALPAERYAALADLFDRVARSFRATRRVRGSGAKR